MKKRTDKASQTIGFRPKWPGLREELEARAHNGSRSLADQVQRMCLHCSAIYKATGTENIEEILEKLGAPKDMKVGGEQVVVSIYGATTVTQKKKG